MKLWLLIIKIYYYYIIKSLSRVWLCPPRSSRRLCNNSQVKAEKKGQEVTRELWDCSHIKCDIRFQGNVIYSLCVERQGRFVKGWTAAESTQHLKKSESKMPLRFFYRPAQRNKFESLSFGEKMICARMKPNTAKKSFLILASSSVFAFLTRWLRVGVVSVRCIAAPVCSADTEPPPGKSRWNSECLSQDAAEASSGCTSVCSFESSETVRASACAISQTEDKSRQASHLIRSTIIQLWRLTKTWCLSSLNFFERGKKNNLAVSSVEVGF